MYNLLQNFTIIYIKLGYPRMEMSKQAELVPSVLNAIEGKPLSHQDRFVYYIFLTFIFWVWNKFN